MVKKANNIDNNNLDSSPIKKLEDGESIEVKSKNSNNVYKIRYTGGVYSCTCPAWQFQNKPIETRTCKHIKEFRGEAAEKKRTGFSNSKTSKSSKASKSSKKSTKSSSPGDKSQSEISVMLAHNYRDYNIDPTGWLMSEKLDGVRGLWDGNEFYSRQGKIFYVPDWFKEGLPSFGLDGEFFIGRKRFEDTSSIVRRQDKSEHWKQVKYLVFDSPDLDGVFTERFETVKNWFASNNCEQVNIVEQIPCKGDKHLWEEFEKIISIGGEGLMVRKPDDEYFDGRTNNILKLKSVYDAEACVKGYTNGTGKYKGLIGSLIVETPEGKEFKLGSGLSDQDRENPPKIGSVVTYKYTELTKYGIPRHPRYFRVRNDVEWEDIINLKTPERPISNITINNKKTLSNKKKCDTSKEKKNFDLPIKNTYYYELVDENSSKFWEITIDKSSFTTRYGKLGSNGTSTKKQWSSPEEAEIKAKKLRETKEQKGYLLK
ncbi:MAG: DNA ligase [Candidatus Lokiarchaeota archaeon]|nr:DNA ligase [Candidatus Lokiarchaeota archaeon]